MGVALVPIVDGMLEEWKQDMRLLEGEHAQDMRELNARHGLTSHRAYLAQMPDGSSWVVAVHEGPGADTFLQTIVESQHSFDKWFKDHIGRVHGINMDEPIAAPMPELMLDTGQ